MGAKVYYLVVGPGGVGEADILKLNPPRDIVWFEPRLAGRVDLRDALYDAEYRRGGAKGGSYGSVVGVGFSQGERSRQHTQEHLGHFLK